MPCVSQKTIEQLSVDALVFSTIPFSAAQQEPKNLFSVREKLRSSITRLRRHRETCPSPTFQEQRRQQQKPPQIQIR